MELTDTRKQIFTETGRELKGNDRWMFMAQVVKALGKGRQRRAEIELGWNWRAIREGMRELKSGFRCYDKFSARGGKPVERHLPNLWFVFIRPLPV